MLPGNVAELCEFVGRGGQVAYLFFWGHRAGAGGAIGRSCLSQWWPSPFSVDGLTYAAGEHYMMAEKARLFGDHEVLAKILAGGSPGKVKALGRQVRNFDEQVWIERREQVVRTANLAKFQQNPELGAFLFRTGSKVLVEASPVDRIWGIGLAADDPLAASPEHWPGANLLGFVLMDVRSQLRDVIAS